MRQGSAVNRVRAAKREAKSELKLTDSAGLRGAKLLGDRRVSSLLSFRWPSKAKKAGKLEG